MERLKKDERKPEKGHRGVKALEERGREPEEGHQRWKGSRRKRERAGGGSPEMESLLKEEGESRRRVTRSGKTLE